MKPRKIKTISILGVLLFCWVTSLERPIRADEPRVFTVKPHLDVAPSIQVGDTIGFSLEATAPEGASASTPEISSIEFNSEVAGDKEKATLFEWGWILNPFVKESVTPSFHFNASPVKSGEIVLPKLILKNSKGEVIGQTREWKADVLSALSNPQDKASEMRPPAAVSVPIVTLLGIVALLLGVLTAAFFSVRYYLRRQSLAKKKPAKVEVILPEHEEALKALDALMQKGFYEKGLFKSHYFGISEIIKHYVARRYGFDAEESTSRELLRHLEIEIGIKDQILDDLEKLFEKLDWVKFTDHVPDSLEALQLLNQARDWVKRTQAQPLNQTGVEK